MQKFGYGLLSFCLLVFGMALAIFLALRLWEPESRCLVLQTKLLHSSAGAIQVGWTLILSKDCDLLIQSNSTKQLPPQSSHTGVGEEDKAPQSATPKKSQNPTVTETPSTPPLAPTTEPMENPTGQVEEEPCQYGPLWTRNRCPDNPSMGSASPETQEDQTPGFNLNIPSTHSNSPPLPTIQREEPQILPPNVVQDSLYGQYLRWKEQQAEQNVTGAPNAPTLPAQPVIRLPAPQLPASNQNPPSTILPGRTGQDNGQPWQHPYTGRWPEPPKQETLQ